MKNVIKAVLAAVLLISTSISYATGGSGHESHDVKTEDHHITETNHNDDASHGEEAAEMDPIHHVMDAHDVHFWGEGHDAVSLPLPVILWTDNGLVTFMSSEFHHDDAGHHIVEKNGMSFVKYHEKIYQLDQSEELKFEASLNDSTSVSFVMSDFHKNEDGEMVYVDEATNSTLVSKDHKVSVKNGDATTELDFHPTTTMPIDLSITKVVLALFLVAFIVFFVFRAVAKRYKTETPQAPKGIAGWMEPLVLFVRDFSKENIGEAKYMKFMPYLLTVFFFIWFGNLFGLIPFIGGFNLTGNITITLMLALFTLVIQLIFSKWAFWKHMLMPPGVPVLLYPILVPIELAGVLIKPAALTIRLFANITAGHIIVLSIIGIIFMNQHIAWAALSVPLSLFISVLEVTLVAFLQAYIFTMLSSMFIGAAVDEGHH